jgi:hypothetical protein
MNTTTGTVSYGQTTSLGITQNTSDGAVSNHSVTLNGLAKGNKYYYIITANSTSGLTAKSNIITFVTQ